MTGERLQKFLAGAGVASRRKAEALVAEGRVQVNGQVVREPGTRVDPERDLVAVDGAPVSRREGEAYYLLYKPSGCLTTLSDPQGRPTARDYLGGVRERVFPWAASTGTPRGRCSSPPTGSWRTSWPIPATATGAPTSSR